mmetsp:Transcript_17732/g.48261  ORF Transcript_17732/g.48261 Transcript_17732/m.48261 type:complete len:154 (+) Transcript_17732:118-579(+)
MLNQFPSPMDLQGAVQGTVVYLSLYATLLFFQFFSKSFLMAQKKQQAKKEDGHILQSFRSVKYYNRDDKLALIGDRSAGNFAEWALMFLPLMWMHAVFVDPSKSFLICAIYSFFRVVYPVLFINGVLVLLSTFPNYMVILYLSYNLVTEVALA